MWAAILALFPTVAGWINLIIGWFQANEAAQNAANSAEASAEIHHQNDGAQSVADKDSSDAQNSALDAAAQAMDNPTPIIVQPPGGKTT